LALLWSGILLKAAKLLISIGRVSNAAGMRLTDKAARLIGLTPPPEDRP